MVCYKCLLGHCRAHAEDAVDMVNVACSYVEEIGDEDDDDDGQNPLAICTLPPLSSARQQ